MNGPLPPTWLKRAAISWSADISSDSESSPYWDPTLLSQISSLSCSFCPGTVVSGTESKDGQVNVRNCCISYESLLIIAALIVDSLRRIIQSYTFENQTRDKEIGIPVAVAIPEGPLLAIAILAVHVLGEPQPVSEGGNGSTYAILVPIEPSEGRERLRHMINDSQPAIVLCLPGQDTSRIEQVCCSKEAVGIDLSKDSLSKVQLRQTQIIDFSQLIRDSIRNWEKESLSNVSPQVMNKYTAGNELDHQADFFNQISMCAMFMRTKNAQHENIPQKLDQSKNRISHIVYTSGTTGRVLDRIPCAVPFFCHICDSNLTTTVLLISCLMKVLRRDVSPLLGPCRITLGSRMKCTKSPPNPQYCSQAPFPLIHACRMYLLHFRHSVH